MLMRLFLKPTGKFRNLRKSSSQTFEFAREKDKVFDKWCAANDVK